MNDSPPLRVIQKYFCLVRWIDVGLKIPFYCPGLNLFFWPIVINISSIVSYFLPHIFILPVKRQVFRDRCWDSWMMNFLTSKTQCNLKIIEALDWRRPLSLVIATDIALYLPGFVSHCCSSAASIMWWAPIIISRVVYDKLRKWSNIDEWRIENNRSLCYMSWRWRLYFWTPCAAFDIFSRVFKRVSL